MSGEGRSLRARAGSRPLGRGAGSPTLCALCACGRRARHPGCWPREGFGGGWRRAALRAREEGWRRPAGPCGRWRPPAPAWARSPRPSRRCTLSKPSARWSLFSSVFSASPARFSRPRISLRELPGRGCVGLRACLVQSLRRPGNSAGSLRSHQRGSGLRLQEGARGGAALETDGTGWNSRRARRTGTQMSDNEWQAVCSLGGAPGDGEGGRQSVPGGYCWPGSSRAAFRAVAVWSRSEGASQPRVDASLDAHFWREVGSWVGQCFFCKKNPQGTEPLRASSQHLERNVCPQRGAPRIVTVSPHHPAGQGIFS